MENTVAMDKSNIAIIGMDTPEIKHKDALGNPIIIGYTYGWVRNDNGFTTVMIGIAEKFTEKGVTFRLISAKRSLWGGDPEALTIGSAEYNGIKEKINVRGLLTFPINK